MYISEREAALFLSSFLLGGDKMSLRVNSVSVSCFTCLRLNQVHIIEELRLPGKQTSNLLIKNIKEWHNYKAQLK